jgi:hypothetical protein
MGIEGSSFSDVEPWPEATVDDDANELNEGGGGRERIGRSAAPATKGVL